MSKSILQTLNQRGPGRLLDVCPFVSGSRHEIAHAMMALRDMGLIEHASTNEPAGPSRKWKITRVGIDAMRGVI